MLRLDLAASIDLARAARHDAEATHRAKDEFLALLGHELRDPLAPMALVLRLMSNGNGSEDIFPTERAILERQLARLTELVDDLQDVSRMTRGGSELVRTTVSLVDVLARVTAMGPPFLARNRRRLDIEVAPVALDVHADEARLAQALAGLITSAARLGREDGHVVVAARRDDDDALLTIRGMNPPGMVMVPPGEVSPLGNPDARGLGVGFPIHRNLITLHGGTVSAVSDDAAGGFDVRLPLVEPDEMR